MADLQGRRVVGADGILGVVEDVYFDDRWRVRYFVVHDGEEGTGGRVLVSPARLKGGRVARDCICTSMSREEFRHAGRSERTELTRRPLHDTALCSARELASYTVAARDGPVGQVKDLLVEDRMWSVIELVADTHQWLPGKPALISPDAVDDIEWRERAVRLRLTREEVEHSPRLQ